jgi:hypothetical protein
LSEIIPERIDLIIETKLSDVILAQTKWDSPEAALLFGAKQ